MRPRREEPRIDKANPLAHQRQSVSLAVAADFLEVDRKTLGIWLLERRLAYLVLGKRRKIEVAELVAFKQRSRVERRAS